MTQKRRAQSSRSRLVGVLAIAGVLSIPAVSVSAGHPSLRATAAAMVASEIGVPSRNLRLTASARLALPLTARFAKSFKFIERRTGNIRSITLDSFHRSVDAEALVNAERRAWERRVGRLDERLIQSLATAVPGDRLHISVWLKTPRIAARPFPGATAGEPDPAMMAASAKAAAETQRVAERTAGRVARAFVRRLAGLGLEAHWHGGAPTVDAWLPVETISMIGRWPEIARVFLSGKVASTGDVYTVVVPTVGAIDVQQRGYTGAGVKVAQDEVGGSIAMGNPYLRGVVVDSNAILCYPSAPAFPGHATAVAGMIHWTAPGAQVLATGSCQGVSAALQDRALAAVNWGAAVVNHSWGESRKTGANNLLDAGDLYFDWLTRTRSRLQVFAAGNDGQTSGNVGSPGSAYNVLTVGNFDDRGTVTWADDLTTASSSFRDPASGHSDREKPEISAPGTDDYSTTTASPWWGSVGSGTSYAAPIVTGIAAQLLQRAPQLLNYPTATKAILMATAIHNIEGATRLSEYDGAGGTWAPYADDIAHGVNGSWSAYNWTCATAAEFNVGTMAVVAGKRTRVVIAWNTDTSYANYYTQPSADYDLQVLTAANAIVKDSSSWDNTYEIVDFVPAATATYTIRVHRSRCNVSPGQLSVAWWRAP